jgi:tetratricopeptide (TPR) repeat protein
VEFVIVNNDLSVDESQCRAVLGEVGHLKNLHIHTPLQNVDGLAAYRFGAKQCDADYVFLVSRHIDLKLEFRLINGLRYLIENELDGVKWDIESENQSPFDILTDKKAFLMKTNPANGKMEMKVDVVRGLASKSLACDYYLWEAKKHLKNGNYENAYQSIQSAEAIGSGGAGEQFIIELYSEVCFKQKKYDEAEKRCQNLIDRGYGADNWIRLGKILQKKKQYTQAVQAYRKGLGEIGLSEGGLNSHVFPLVVSKEFGAFTCLVGMGECMIETGDYDDAARVFRRASKLKANSHRPFLGFGKLFLLTGDLEQAEKALYAAYRANDKDSATHQALGELYEKKDRFGKAFEYYLKAYQMDQYQPGIIDPLFRVGGFLNRFEELAEILTQFRETRPGHIKAILFLSQVYLKLEQYEEAEELIRQGMVFDQKNPGFSYVYREIEASKRRKMATGLKNMAGCA